ncbi:MAG TPA: hypothetical protein IGS53_19115 [Leptolyngbyaceae cyanobacterium M33_DOE_097]|uniref:DUF4386 family protein n=1 Tax=Oscillatoriales cyanobacterium SpSt-418 TaxID=2282169 RepID=A0A7C3PU05_9CYAN|nr:hypothetical protein [Leptolyngbyaceae cyanobacterium M33_DOE_097]
MQPQDPLPRHRRLKGPKAGAVAGVVFSVLLITSLVLALFASPLSLLNNEARFAANSNLLLIALNLVPFAGVAFLWFIGAVRDHLGDREDQFFASVFFGSGLLFLAMLFVSSAVSGSLIFLYNLAATPTIATTYYNLGQFLSQEVLSTYGIKMAGVFMISTCTLFLRTQVIPKWMVWLGYGFAALMLLRIGHINRLGWVVLLFPLWVLLISIYILIDHYRKAS